MSCSRSCGSGSFFWRAPAGDKWSQGHAKLDLGPGGSGSFCMARCRPPAVAENDSASLGLCEGWRRRTCAGKMSARRQERTRIASGGLSNCREVLGDSAGPMDLPFTVEW